MDFEGAGADAPNDVDVRLPGPLASPWLEAGIAVFDKEGNVVTLSPDLAAWLGLADPVQKAETSDFLKLLEHRLPEAIPLLTELRAADSGCMERTVSSNADGARSWVRIEAAVNPCGAFVRLSSVLPPPEELAEGGLQHQLGGPARQAQLFLRLVKAEAQLQNLLRRWPGVIFSQRADFTFRYVSPRVEVLTGVSPDEWRSHPHQFWNVVHEADVEELRRQCKLAARTREGVTTNYRIRNAKTGQIYYLLEHRQAVTSGSGLVLGYEGMWLDVTRQTIAEKRVSSAVWKDTLATLTMGLAHDFSNMMAGIIAYSEEFLSKTEPEHPFREGLALIRQNSFEAAQLVQRITNLHRCKTGERTYHDLNQLIAELTDLVKKILPRRIELEYKLNSDSLPVYMDGVEFRQVLLNLALNAADAMPNRGKLILSTRRLSKAVEIPNKQGTPPRAPVLCLSVQDTGCGIPERHLDSIFDAFFTTKPLNKGSGLGLYNARLFAEKHHGAISVESTEGVGTTFHLWLPEADFTESERVETRVGTRRSVLLAGEPGLLTDSTAELLRVHDYYVVMAGTANRTRELIVSEEAGFDAIMVVTAPQDAGFIALLGDLALLAPKAKLVLQVIGAHQDHIETGLLDRMHLVVANSMGEEEFVRRLEQLLGGGKTL